MKYSFLLLVILSLAPLARADDQTQAVQQALKDQGFYYGEVDGQPGSETDAAIRRYQIRQGLDVTGKLDAQTLASLNLAAKNGTAPAPSSDSAAAQPAAPQETQPPNAVVQSDHDFLRNQPAPAATPPAMDDEATTPQPPPQPQEPPAAPPDAGQTLVRQYAWFLRKTPYETAPPEVQQSTVQRAQQRLAREGFYRGLPDGQLSDSLSRALTAYQRYAELRPSGRLDMDTLEDMNLMPKRRMMVGPPPPYDGGAPVYRGIWVH